MTEHQVPSLHVREAGIAKLKYYLGDSPQPHRERPTPPFWSALVTKALHPAEPMSRCKEARAAVRSEIDAHVAEGTWDHGHPEEQEVLKKKFPDAHFADLLAIVGIKNHESSNPKDHIWKGRVLFGGHKIKNSADVYV